MDPLFYQDLVVATLSSGSRGNCTYIGDTRSGVLVDCGLSARQITGRLESCGLSEVRIDAVLVTHEHKDHVGGARVLDDRLFARQGARVPFHLTVGTMTGLDPRCAPVQMTPVTPGQPFRIGQMTIEPFAIPHDTYEPVAYLVSTPELTVGVLTDLGSFTGAIAEKVARMDVGIIEFNHDLERLMDGPYPYSLKTRVRGPRGHLSNAQAAEMLTRAVPERMQHLILAHLSEENNTPELALEAASRAMHQGHAGLEIRVASQDHAVGPVRVKPAARPALAKPVARPAPAKLAAPKLAADAQLGLFGL